MELSTSDINKFNAGYTKAIEDCILMIEDYKEKHSNNRKEYPINYGTLLDFENQLFKLKEV